jgi:hypothetical protein
MTSTIDPKAIGKPKRERRHVRTLTGSVLDTVGGIRVLTTTGPVINRIPPRDRRVGQGQVAAW